MGVIDMAKMMRKAQQAKTAMKKVFAAGKSKSGLTSILLNGLNEIEEVVFEDALFEQVDSKKLAKEVIEAYNNAKKELEQQLAQNLDMDSIRDMFAA